LECANNERLLRFVEPGEHSVLVALTVHDVDGLTAAVQMLFHGPYRAKPALRLAKALLGCPVFLADALLEPEDRLQREQPQRATLSVRAQREREVAEEALGRRLDQTAQALALCLPPELELGRVVGDDDAR